MGLQDTRANPSEQRQRGAIDPSPGRTGGGEKRRRIRREWKGLGAAMKEVVRAQLQRLLSIDKSGHVQDAYPKKYSPERLPKDQPVDLRSRQVRAAG